MKAPADKDTWDSKSLGSLAKFVNGRSFRSDEWGTEGLPIIRIQDLTGSRAQPNYYSGYLDPKHRVNNGDVLVSWSASLDAYIWDRGPAALNQHIYKVEENSAIVDRRFLYYALRAVMDVIRLEIHGSTMQHITKPKFEAVEIRVPRKIGAQLELVALLEKKLTEANRTREALIRQSAAAQAVLGAVIDKVLTSYDDGAGHLGDVFKRPPQSGWSPVCDGAPDGTPVLTLTSVTGFIFRPEAIKLTSEKTDPKASYWAHDGDLFVARSNAPDLVGHAGIARGITQPTIFPDLLLRLDLDRAKVLPEFVHLWLMGARSRRYVRTEAVGSSSSMKKINQKILANLPFPTNVDITTQQKAIESLAEPVRAARRMAQTVMSAISAANALPTAMFREVFSPEINEEIE